MVTILTLARGEAQDHGRGFRIRVVTSGGGLDRLRLGDQNTFDFFVVLQIGCPESQILGDEQMKTFITKTRGRPKMTKGDPRRRDGSGLFL